MPSKATLADPLLFERIDAEASGIRGEGRGS
jgi:hypothetical protein